jgi:hypothetical protein
MLLLSLALAGDDRAAYAVPLVSYDSNLLLGYGLYGQAVVGDPGGDRPYKASVDAQFYRTTGDYVNHFLRFDLPGIAGSRFRLGGEARFVRWAQAPFYGVGTSAPRPLVVGQDVWYQQQRLMWRSSLRIELFGDAELLLLYNIRNEQVAPYADSLLAEERPEGIDGGRYAWGGVGFVWDATDNEIDPSEGHAVDASVRLAHPWLGSDWTVPGVNARWRSYTDLVEGPGRAVLATHLMVDMRWGDEPFFNQAYAGGMGRGVVGGRWLLKGLAEERYRVDNMAFANVELRTTVWSPTLRNAPTDWMLVPFIDTARLWMWEDPAATPWLHVTGGVGLRINVKELIVFRIDVGYGRDETEEGRQGQVQTYVLSEHPF